MKIEINELSFSYKKNTPLFQGLSLSAQSGDIVGLLGRNGAGKTTLINLIAGLMCPDDGACKIDGRDVAARHPATLADIFYMPEEIGFSRSVSGGRYHRAHAPLYPRFDDDAYARYCREFEVNELASLQKLSMGERKKFFLAFGLATGAKLLLLDEPTNALDIPAKGFLRQYVTEDVAQREGMAIISTHQVREVENLVNPVVIIEKGEVIFWQSAEAIAEKLTTEIMPEAPPNAIHTQATPGGVAVLRARNADEAAGRVDWEMLFNAAMTNAKALCAPFEK